MTTFTQYLFWIPSIILLCIMSGFCVSKHIITKQPVWGWLVIGLSVGFGIVYSLFMRYSTHPVLDNLIYNALIVITVSLTLAQFGFVGKFGLMQYTGIGLIIAGIILYSIHR